MVLGLWWVWACVTLLVRTTADLAKKWTMNGNWRGRKGCFYLNNSVFSVVVPPWVLRAIWSYYLQECAFLYERYHLDDQYIGSVKPLKNGIPKTSSTQTLVAAFGNFIFRINSSQTQAFHPETGTSGCSFWRHAHLFSPCFQSLVSLLFQAFLVLCVFSHYFAPYIPL